MSRIVEITNNLNNKTGDTEERLDFNDMYNSFKNQSTTQFSV